jgi:hypothetical protein
MGLILNLVDLAGSETKVGQTGTERTLLYKRRGWWYQQVPDEVGLLNTGDRRLLTGTPSLSGYFKTP